MKRSVWMMTAALLAAPVLANAQVAEPPKTVRPDQLAFRDLYTEPIGAAR